MLVALFLMASVKFVNAQQNNHMKNVKKTGYAPVNGLNMYYEIHGEGGIPLVLIHGGGSTIESSFGRILPLLAEHGQVIAVELQAHGRTSDRDAPESFEQDADDVAALLGYLKIGKANILGFSNGGTSTLQIAIRHQEIVNKIVVISCNYQREGMVPGFFDGFKNATLANMPDVLKDAYLKVAPDKSHLQVMFDKDVARMANFKDIPDEFIRSIKSPVFIIMSAHDPVLPEHAIKLSRTLPSAQLAILPGMHGSTIGALESGEVIMDGKLPGITVTLVEAFLK